MVVLVIMHEGDKKRGILLINFNFYVEDETLIQNSFSKRVSWSEIKIRPMWTLSFLKENSYKL